MSKNILLESFNRFHGVNLTLSLDVDQDNNLISEREKKREKNRCRIIKFCVTIQAVVVANGKTDKV